MPNTIEIEDIRYALQDFSLHAIGAGKEDGNLVLCLHGWLDNAASFLPLIPFLSNHQVIAIDWPGHGMSSHRSLDAHYHFVDWVYDLLQLFEKNKWGAIDIVGHSMGGMVASAFASAFPEKVKSLTLIDSIGFISANANESTEQLRDGMLSRLKNTPYFQKKKAKNFHSTPESAIKARVAVSDLSYEHAKILVDRGLIEEEDGFIWRSDVRLRNKSPYRITLKQAEQYIKDIKCPVQLIHGEKGIEFVNAGIKHFGPMFKNIIIHELPGGHHVHMEFPVQTAEFINSFISHN